jgi:hypothetical protein
MMADVLALFFPYEIKAGTIQVKLYEFHFGHES